MARTSAPERAKIDPVEAVGRLVAGLGHNLRSPLTGLRGYGELLGQDTTADSRGRWGEGLQGGIDDLELLIDGISRYQIPRDLKVGLVPARGLMEEAWKLAERHCPGARSRGIHLNNHLSSVAVLQVDPFHFRNLLVNLLQNALDASPPGSEITVRTGQGDELLRVEDCGPGLGALSSDDIVQPFFTTRQDRAGLGLSVAGAIADRHGLELLWEEREEGGLRVRIMIKEHFQRSER
ncbi:HAMP domain-containing histidine kinase [bacterium]|nr:HAMP domain-containing histidine kinase [bacterium]